MLFYLDLNTSACAGIPSNIKNCGLAQVYTRDSEKQCGTSLNGKLCLKSETKSSWPVKRKEASVSAVTWHDDWRNCFLYCSITQWLARAPVWGERNNSWSTTVHEEVKNIFPYKLLLLYYYNPKPDPFQFSYACV